MNLREMKAAIASAEKDGATDETEVMLLTASVGLQRAGQAMVWKRDGKQWEPVRQMFLIESAEVVGDMKVKRG